MIIGKSSSWIVVVLCAVPGLAYFLLPSDVSIGHTVIQEITRFGADMLPPLAAMKEYSEHPDLAILVLLLSHINGVLLFIAVVFGVRLFGKSGGLPIKAAKKDDPIKQIFVLLLFGFFIFAIFTLYPEKNSIGKFDRILSSMFYGNIIIRSVWSSLYVYMIAVILSVFSAYLYAFMTSFFFSKKR